MTTLRIVRRRLAWYAWLPIEVAIAYVLFAFFTSDVSPYAMFRSLLLTAISVGLVTLGLGWLARDMHRGGVATLLLILAGLEWDSSLGTIAVLAMAVVAILLDLLPHRTLGWNSISRSMSVYATALLLVIVSQAALSGRLVQAMSDLQQGTGLAPSAGEAPGGALPDICVILVDGYARADTLRDWFKFNETPFTDFLTSRGFDVVSDSHSNYPATPLTFASMLNMAYLDQLPQTATVIADSSKNVDPASVGLFRPVIADNRVFQLARRFGYQVVTVASGFEQVALRKADVYLDGGEINSFEWQLLAWGGGFTDLITAVVPDLAGSQGRNRLKDEFTELAQVVHSPSMKPRLTFVHLMNPHPPALFDAAGRPISPIPAPYLPETNDPVQARTDYAGDVAHLNNLLQTAIDDVITATNGRAVIVLMSDHGSRFGTDSHPYERTVESLDNFLAVRAPGHSGLLAGSPTPVNLFPFLFNAYLGTDLPLQPNRTYMSSIDVPLSLEEVPLPSGPPLLHDIATSAQAGHSP